MEYKRSWQDFRLAAERNPSIRGLSLYAFWTHKYEPDVVHTIRDVTIEDAGRETQMEPSFYLSDEHVQQLIDDLWRAGYRPTVGRYESDVLNAKDEHIKDSRMVITRLLDWIDQDHRQIERSVKQIVDELNVLYAAPGT